MKNLLESLVVCISMYSIIPMPHLVWSKENIRTAYCFFPFIGILIGGLEYGWYVLAMKLGLESVFYAAIATLIPVILTGGIHIDGWVDTCDGIFSHGTKEERLQILADPRAGAFAVIYCVVYFIAMFGVYSQIGSNGIAPLFTLFIYSFSRAWGGFMMITWKSAKKSGLQHTFKQENQQKSVQVVLAIWMVLLFGFALWYHWKLVIVALVLTVLLLLILHRYFYKVFGGVTGDLTGFTISFMELLLLCTYAVGGVLIG